MYRSAGSLSFSSSVWILAIKSSSKSFESLAPRALRGASGKMQWAIDEYC
jgi:hypothetical protein